MKEGSALLRLPIYLVSCPTVEGTLVESFVALTLTRWSFHPNQRVGVSGWKAKDEPRRAGGTAASVAAIPPSAGY